MPVPAELLDKIEDYRKGGYSEDEIVRGLLQSKKYPKVVSQIKTFSGKGYDSKEILAGMRQSPVVGKMKKAPFIARHPNLYGAYGAGWETVKTLIPYIRYIDPSERERFGKLSTQKQTRELLLQNLETVAILGTSGLSAGGKAVLKAYLPKTYKALSKVANLRIGGKVKPVVKPPPKVVVEKPTPIPKAEVIPKVEPITAKGIPKTQTLGIYEQEQVMKAAIEKAVANPDSPIVLDETTRIFKRIAGAVKSGEISPNDLPNILQRYKITPEQLAKDIVYSGHHAGQTLNQLSQVSKAINKAFPKDKAVQELLSKAADRPRSAYEMFADAYRAVDNKRRMLMVSQVATSARNALSQAGRYTINIFDDALQGTMKTVGGESPKKAYSEMFSDFAAMWGRLAPAKRKTLEAILDKYPIEKAKMFSAPIHDITMGDKVARTVMALNRGQEYFFRRMAFDAKVSALCKKAGIKKTGDIPESILNESIKHALELTYAASPESAPGKAIMQLYKKVPFLTTIQPYPRFWMNSLKFLWDFNPTGFLSTAGHLAKKDPSKALKAASKAMVGSLMLGTAFAARTSKYAGERYYEWKIGTDPKTGNTKYYDLRAFAPYTSYLYIAEQVLHPERIRPYDRIQALVGINRIGGTGLILLDVLRNKSSDSAVKMLKEFGGQWLGGFTVPFRTIKDFWAGIEKREAEVQTTRESPITGPAITNIPGSQNWLPQAQRITRGEPYKREETVKRQLTGLTVKTKTPLEQEIDILGMENIWPNTGDTKLNRLITKLSGSVIERKGNQLIKSPVYRNADDMTRTYLLKTLMGRVKGEAKRKLFIPHIEKEISKMKGGTKKKEYVEKLVKRGKLSQTSFTELMVRNPELFTLDEWRELGKSLLLR